MFRIILPIIFVFFSWRYVMSPVDPKKYWTAIVLVYFFAVPIFFYLGNQLDLFILACI
jgi:hypothetical protein